MTDIYPTERDDISQEKENFIKSIDYKAGLSSEQVRYSKERFGTNILSPPPRIPLWVQFLLKFKDPTIMLLSFAALISILIGFHEGKFIEGIGIIIAIILATGISFYSEYRSGKEFDALNKDRVEKAKVRRGGQFHAILSEELVVGDVVFLEMGDRVPADGWVIKTTGLYIDQSLLTGESRPVRKTKEFEREESGSAFPTNMVYRGTLVSDGSGVLIVTAVGDETEVGRIAASLSDQEIAQTPLQERLEVLSKQIGYIGMSMAALIFIALVVMDYRAGKITGLDIVSIEEIIKYFMVAVTIIVVAVPEGLPMMVTMSLAFNMRKMAKENCLIKKLDASETVGSVTVICSDKTGTLTQNEMRPVLFYLGGSIFEQETLEGAFKALEWEDIVLNSALNSTANLEIDEGSTYRPIGNATEGALLGLLYDLDIKYWDLRDEYEIVRQIPFSSERKKMATVVEKDGSCICFEKGAPAIIIAECGSISINGRLEPIENYTAKIDDVLKEASHNAYRVIAFSKNNIDCACSDSDECCINKKQKTLTGLVGIADPVRPEVPAAVEACHTAGIDVKMVTGDDLATAMSIARECHIIRHEDDMGISHDDFEALTDEELEEKIDKIKVLARSKPLDKLRLVKSLHVRRETVGVTGDGTNDAPALRQADVGISMGKTGTEVAKEASDIVLLDDNFKTIVTGILWGRTIYQNIQKLIQFQLTVNVVALLVAFLGPFLGIDLPLTVVQLLWVNIIMDTFAALALSTDPPRKDTMKKKPKPRDQHIITRQMAGFIGITGLFMTITLLLLLKTSFLGGSSDIEKMTILFTTFVMFQFWNEFNCRSLSHRQSPFEGISKNTAFLTIISIILIVQIIVVNFGGELFRTVPISLEAWIKIALLTFLVIPVGYFAKWLTHVLFEKK